MSKVILIRQGKLGADGKLSDRSREQARRTAHYLMERFGSQPKLGARLRIPVEIPKVKAFVCGPTQESRATKNILIGEEFFRVTFFEAGEAGPRVIRKKSTPEGIYQEEVRRALQDAAYRPEGGRSTEEAAIDLDLFLRRIAQGIDRNGPIIVVAHPEAIDAFLRVNFSSEQLELFRPGMNEIPLTLQEGLDLMLPDCSLTEFTITADGYRLHSIGRRVYGEDIGGEGLTPSRWRR